ncbi:MAG: hypothetical protein E6719_04220 [Dermabacter sp.]|nr:hypothetical protein [Dermabacter sp.]
MLAFFTVTCAAIAVAGALFSIIMFVNLVRDERAAHKPTDHQPAKQDHSDN